MTKDDIILTQKQITEITKLRRQGVSYEDIAKKMSHFITSKMISNK